MMKKFFPAILIVLAVAVALLPTTAVAQTNYQQTQEYLFMQEFCQKFPNRVAGTQQEREASQFLAETFEQVVQGKHNSSVNVVPFACLVPLVQRFPPKIGLLPFPAECQPPCWGIFGKTLA